MRCAISFPLLPLPLLFNLLNGKTTKWLTISFPAWPPKQIISKILDSTAYIRTLDPELRRMATDSWAQALKVVFTVQIVRILPLSPPLTSTSFFLPLSFDQRATDHPSASASTCLNNDRS